MDDYIRLQLALKTASCKNWAERNVAVVRRAAAGLDSPSRGRRCRVDRITCTGVSPYRCTTSCVCTSTHCTTSPTVPVPSEAQSVGPRPRPAADPTAGSWQLLVEIAIISVMCENCELDSDYHQSEEAEAGRDTGTSQRKRVFRLVQRRCGIIHSRSITVI